MGTTSAGLIMTALRELACTDKEFVLIAIRGGAGHRDDHSAAVVTSAQHEKGRKRSGLDREADCSRTPAATQPESVSSRSREVSHRGEPQIVCRECFHFQFSEPLLLAERPPENGDIAAYDWSVERRNKNHRSVLGEDLQVS